MLHGCIGIARTAAKIRQLYTTPAYFYILVCSCKQSKRQGCTDSKGGPASSARDCEKPGAVHTLNSPLRLLPTFLFVEELPVVFASKDHHGVDGVAHDLQHACN